MVKKIILSVLILLSAGLIFCLIYHAVNPEPSVSYIDEQVSEYTKTGQWKEEAIRSAFSKDSAEVFFSKGMKYYADNNFKEAGQYFDRAAEKSYKDSALPVYLNIYRNECVVRETGNSDIKYIKRALDAMAECPELPNQPYLVWHLIYPVTEIKNPETSASDLLQRYLDRAAWLSEDETLQMESYQAILKNITGDYSESILLFYNILNEAQNLPDSYSIIKTRSVCISYIADMYYSYEDYDRAKELYLELLEEKIDDSSVNAKLKYTAYVNVANIYLKQKDYERCKETAAETEAILPYLPENTAAETKAFLSDILANAELEQGNLSGADAYFKECENFLQSSRGSAFFDTEIYFRLTQCRILKESGDFKQAEDILKQLLNDNIIVEENIKYEAMKLLADIYRSSGQDAEYLKEQELLLEEQNIRIRQYQSAYCEVIRYYDQLVVLQKEHTISLHQNEILAAVLFIALFLLLIIIKISMMRYRDSITDSLSGLYNRKQLEKETALYEKSHHRLVSYGIIMADIDFFKKYNDTYGHAAGDEVIRRVSAVLRRSVRENDIVIRYGGEEFLVLLKNINSSTIVSIAERIRLNIEKEKICHKASVCSDYVSLSIGCFYVENTSRISLSDAIKEADKALYKSKQNGRNTATII